MKKPFLSSINFLVAAFALAFVANLIPQGSCLDDNMRVTGATTAVGGAAARSGGRAPPVRRPPPRSQSAEARDEKLQNGTTDDGSASDDSNSTASAANTTDAPSLAAVPAGGATEAPVPAPTVAPTLSPVALPTKRYNPDPDGGDESHEKEEKKRRRLARSWRIIIGIFVFLALLWAGCYLRDEIVMFVRSAWSNVRRHGCRGCLFSFCPCLPSRYLGRGAASRGAESVGGPLDQIIFETEDANNDMRRGLIS